MDKRISVIQSLGINPRFQLWREVHFKFLLRIPVSIIKPGSRHLPNGLDALQWLMPKYWVWPSAHLSPQVHVLWEKPRLSSFWGKEQANSNRNVSEQKWTPVWRTVGFPGRAKYPQGKMCFKSVQHANLNINLWFISPCLLLHLCFSWMFLNEKGKIGGKQKEQPTKQKNPKP